MLKVHHLGISQSERVVWLCEELGLDYELICYDRDPETKLAPPAYKALHASGTAPVIEDGDMRLGESGAVLEYIAQTYGNGRFIKTTGDEGFADYLYWLHFANGSMMPNGLIELALAMADAQCEGATLEGLLARGTLAYDMVDQHLQNSRWFAGADFTLADIMMVFPLTTMRAFVPRDISGYSGIKAYLRQVADRPAFQSAREKADPDVAPFLH
jgi:glutathione S-transferase